LYVFSDMPAKAIEIWWSVLSKPDYPLDEALFVVMLTACAAVRDLSLGEQLHSLLLQKNMKLSPSLSGALIGMYAKCGQQEKAKEQLAWMITCGLLPSSFTYVKVLDGCRSKEEIEQVCLFAKKHNAY
ncbi:hypothetical protein, partial [Yersinia pseudotuberculosis]|uniref:hypothetical protein n=1 Tax=Yersinia pseudotuberculosis TaxID=633 RepID=UPI002001A6BD